MYGTVPLIPKAIDDYRSIVTDSVVDELLDLGRALRGLRVLHLNVTAFGTGVADMLSAAVPLMNSLGLAAHWQVVRTAEEFITANRALYTALSGGEVPWQYEMTEVWLRYNRMNASLFDQEFDVVVVHDPQPAAILSSIISSTGQRPSGKWVWHAHLDLAEARPDVWMLLRPHVESFDAVVADAAGYVREDLKIPSSEVILPAIDPLGPRNLDINSETVRTVLGRYGMDVHRPLICQVSAFDRWNDPLGLIDAYRLAKEEIPGLQLVLIATMTAENPETRAYYQFVTDRAAEDPDLYVLSSLNELGNTEMNAFEQAAEVVAQRSIRKGFAWSVTDALWKGRPVVAGKAGNLPLQVEDGETGFLVQSTEECAARIVQLLKDKALAQRMGAAGREAVRRDFLITRYLKDYLHLFLRLT